MRDSSTMSELAKKQRIDPEDRISALPDPLLHDILSFMDLKSTITTGVLSKRWRPLWTSVPSLDLGEWDEGTGRDIPVSITLSLLQFYTCPAIHKFHAHFDYQDLSDCLIDSWVRFAIKRRVKDLRLVFLIQDNDQIVSVDSEDCYHVPEFVTQCRSLEVFTMACGVLDVRLPLCFPSLKTINLYHCSVSVLDTSGCPLLESLVLRNCNFVDYLNIYAPNQELRYLEIVERIEEITEYCPMTIFAPHVQRFVFDGFIRRQEYIVKDLSSLRRATLDLVDMAEFAEEVEVTRLLMELLQCVKHASTLELSLWCMQILPLWEAQGVRVPQFGATRLNLEINYDKSDLRGMALVLRSSLNLESLILDTSPTFLSTGSWHYSADCNYDEAWALLEHSLSTIPHLKMIRIDYFLHSQAHHLVDDPEPGFNMDRFLDMWEKEFKLVKLLLSSCKVLEKLVIRTVKIRFWPLKSELHYGVAQRLLALPRASANAKISLLESSSEKKYEGALSTLVP